MGRDIKSVLIILMVRRLSPSLLTRLNSRTSDMPHLIRPEEGRCWPKRMPVAPKEVLTVVALALVNCRVGGWSGWMMAELLIESCSRGAYCTFGRGSDITPAAASARAHPPTHAKRTPQ